MRLLVGIHLGKIHEQKAFAKFVRQHCKADPHTFLIPFNWPLFGEKSMSRLINDSGISPAQILPVRAKTDTFWDFNFEPYKEGFAKAIETALQNAWAREKVDIVFFGGTTKGCFERIGGDALKELIARLGPSLGRIETAAHWTYKLGGKRVLPLARRRIVPKARCQTRRSKK